MINFPGYKVKQRISEGSSSFVYRALRESDNLSVIIKALKEDFATGVRTTRFRVEYDTWRKVESEHIIRVLDLLEYGGIPFIVMEDFSAISLKDVLKKGALNLNQFLDIGIQVVRALEAIHRIKIIHLDVKPGNILINEQTGIVKLADFGLAHLEYDHEGVVESIKAVGSFPYISPEQTGRLNRQIDYRSDLYSLGVTFFEILTGKLPFNAPDPLDLIYSHIAEKPVFPPGSGIDEVISAIILKLMEKNPDDRYQTANGLLSDLQLCRDDINKYGKLNPFEIAKNDISSSLSIGNHLYGREKEKDFAFQLMDEVLVGGNALLFISGESGVGKTSLVREMEEYLIKKKGIFATGKFDSAQRSPYIAIAGVVGQLIQRLLYEPAESLKTWKNLLQDRVGQGAGILYQLAPSISRLIDVPTDMAAITNPSGLRNKLKAAFQNFVSCITQGGYSLIIFFDDLHWADANSLDLIKGLISDTGNRNFIVICAFRSDEIEKNPDAVEFVKESSFVSIRQEHLRLEPLTHEDVQLMLTGSFHLSANDIGELVDIIYQKTGGNPFYVAEYVKSLYESGFIHLGSRKCEWNSDAIRESQVSENLVNIIRKRIFEIGGTSKSVMNAASIFSGAFDLEALIATLDLPAKEAILAVNELARAGILVKSNMIRIAHDSIRSSLYSHLNEDEKQILHFRASRYFMDRYDRTGLVKDLFKAADQYISSQSIIEDQQLRKKYTNFLAMAGRQARQSAAYFSYLQYMLAAVQVAERSSDDLSEKELIGLLTDRAEAEYLNYLYSDAEKHFNEIYEMLSSPPGEVRILEYRISLFTVQNRLSEALESARIALDALHAGFPGRVGRLDFMKEFFHSIYWTKKYKPEDIIHLNVMVDEKNLAIMRLLESSYVAAYIGKPDLVPYITLRMVNHSLKNGISVYSAFAFAVYGIILGSGMGKYEAGYRFGQLAMNLLNRFDAKSLRCTVTFLFANMINHWKNPLRDNQILFRNAIESGIQNGEFQFASYAINHMFMQRIFMGDNIESLLGDSEEMNRNHIRLEQYDAHKFFNFFRRFAENLHRSKNELSDLNGDDFDESLSLNEWRDTKNHTALFAYYTVKSYLSYFEGEFEVARSDAQKGLEYEGGVFGMTLVPRQIFLSLLALLSLKKTGSGTKILGKNDNKNIKRMIKWANLSPVNYGSLNLIIQGEICRVEGDIKSSENRYRQAFSSSFNEGAMLDSFIAGERLSNLYQEQGENILARATIRESLICLTRIGATGLIRNYYARNKDLIGGISGFEKWALSEVGVVSDSRHGTSSGSTQFDLLSIMKASRYVTEELDLGSMIERMMKILMKGSGATRVILIRENPEYLYVASDLEKGTAIHDDSDNDTSVNKKILTEIPVDKYPELPVSMIYYVYRTGETVVIDDPLKEGMFRNTPYFQLFKPASALCMPVTRKNKLIGILYLENSISNNVFTTDRIHLLSVLTMQAAISMENASLYEDMKRMNQNLEQRVDEEVRKRREREKTIAEQSRLSSMGRLLVSIAHHWRQPLNTLALQIQNLEEVMESGKTDITAIHDVSEEMLQEIQKMSDILNLFTKSMRQSEHAEVFEAGQAVLDIVSLLNPEFNDSDIYIEYDDLRKEDARCCFVRGKPGEFKQAVISILTNARDQIEESVHEPSFVGKVRVTLDKSDENRLRILITDNGGGVPEEIRNKIFEPYFTTRSFARPGLGLYSSRNVIVEDMGGSLDFANRSEGAQFIIEVPLVEELPVENYN